ncbi:sensor histidine kinase [Streptomyces sp. NPDC059918]|uniref:sensor histidine kinase n=1 Tax=unclassified Streptomyces TaxID=2593676 RepID=UPI003654CCD4
MHALSDTSDAGFRAFLHRHLPFVSGLGAGGESPASPESSELFQRRLALRAQTVLRAAVVAGIVTELIVFPPWRNASAAFALCGLYGVWTAWLLIWAWTDRLDIRPVMLVVVDLAVLIALLVVTGDLSHPEWYSTLIDDAFLFISVMAAFQFEPRVTLSVALAAAGLYVACVGFGQSTGSNPYWKATLMQGVFILVLGLGCTLLSAVQGRRVKLIGGLLHHQSWLLDRVMSAEERERDELAEALHDGVLQTVYAALHLIEEAAEEHPSQALEEADRALREATAQLRNSVAVLHSEVLESQGLAGALQTLADQAAARGKFEVRTHCTVQTAGPATDKLLHRTAGELLSNVVKHAVARHVTVSLIEAGQAGWVRLEVADDGVGMSPTTLREKQTAGHIGISSHRSRVEGVGGTFSFRPNSPAGTVVEVRVPKAGGEPLNPWPNAAEMPPPAPRS